MVYSFVVADLFHYGHLQLLQTAKQQGDFHICGVLTDDAAASYRPRPIANFDERVAIISSITVVDRVMAQDDRDPTANLRRIHTEFPGAQLVLVHGNDWQDIPGRDYVESIGGRVVQPEYYRRLSDNKIRQQLAGASGHYEQFTEHFRIDNIVVFEPEQQLFVMSTKANTLRALRPLLTRSRIEPMVTFRVSDWTEDRDRLIDLIRRELGKSRVVVRSSAINEDTYHQSHAGAYISRVNVQAGRTSAISRAIEDVIGSYRAKGHDSPLNQVLVQPHTVDVRSSGVLFTRTPQTGGPYYVINFDNQSGSTESVTGGASSETIEIAHACPPVRWPREWRGLLRAAREIEQIIPGTPLDIEFAIDGKKRVTLFQVRPLACPDAARVDVRRVAKTLLRESHRVHRAMRRVRHLAGAAAAYSDMAFWNPAEIIGDRPHPLDESLYRRLIMDAVWHEALAPLGYTKIAPAPLLVSFGAKSYVDLRCTFNALLPGSLDRPLREKLVAYYVGLLKARPELHDKVEFEVVDNCFYFSLDRRLTQMRRDGFTAREIGAYRASLVDITGRALARGATITRDVENSSHALELGRCRAARSAGGERDWVAAVLTLLHDCRRHGTAPFTLMARLAFIGKRLLKSAVEQGWMSPVEYDRFMDSVQTVASRMRDDDAAVSSGKMTRETFLRRYGHLRPGSYDITSARYADDPGYFSIDVARGPAAYETAATFEPSERLASTISHALERERLPADATELFGFIRRAIEAREYVKFEFTKNLSDALELIARAGASLGFSREELAFLDVPALERSKSLSAPATRELWRTTIERNRDRRSEGVLLSMPPLIFAPRDLEVLRRPLVRPNFVTQKVLCGELFALDGGGIDREAVRGKVVLLEKADPGFDWLFTKGIAGLVTKYGGVASHMAIRCGEFGLPAAIGCGDSIFQQLQRATAVMLDCRNKHVRPLA